MSIRDVEKYALLKYEQFYICQVSVYSLLTCSLRNYLPSVLQHNRKESSGSILIPVLKHSLEHFLLGLLAYCKIWFHKFAYLKTRPGTEMIKKKPCTYFFRLYAGLNENLSIIFIWHKHWEVGEGDRVGGCQNVGYMHFTAQYLIMVQFCFVLS